VEIYEAIVYENAAPTPSIAGTGNCPLLSLQRRPNPIQYERAPLRMRCAMLRKHPPESPVLSCLSCFRKPSVGFCQVISNSPDPGIARRQRFINYYYCRWLTVCVSLFGRHIAWMPDETYAKKILTASVLENWRRPPGHPRTTWMKTIQQDLKCKRPEIQ